MSVSRKNQYMLIRLFYNWKGDSPTDADAVSDSVIGWIDCLFNIWPFTEIKNLPKHINFTKVSSKFANTKWTLSKWPKFFNNISKWQNFAKSGHTVS